MKRLTEIPDFIEIEIGGIVLHAYGKWVKGDDDDRGFFGIDTVLIPIDGEHLDVTSMLEALNAFDAINEAVDEETLTWELEDD